MSAWLFRRGYCFPLAAAVVLLVCCSSSADPPEKDDLAGKRFGALKDRLPKILLRIFSELYWDAEVELARRTGPAEAKITIVFRTREVKKDKEKEVGTAFIYTRFYDGNWTTTGWDGCEGNVIETPRLKLLVHRIMRAIDKSGE